MALAALFLTALPHLATEYDPNTGNLSHVALPGDVTLPEATLKEHGALSPALVTELLIAMEGTESMAVALHATQLVALGPDALTHYTAPRQTSLPTRAALFVLTDLGEACQTHVHLCSLPTLPSLDIALRGGRGILPAVVNTQLNMPGGGLIRFSTQAIALARQLAEADDAATHALPTRLPPAEVEALMRITFSLVADHALRNTLILRAQRTRHEHATISDAKDTTPMDVDDEH